jgi:hypothetical protein
MKLKFKMKERMFSDTLKIFNFQSAIFNGDGVPI